MIYPLFRPLLFALDPETAHELTFAGLDLAVKSGAAHAFTREVPASPVTAMGLTFPNRVGVATRGQRRISKAYGLVVSGGAAAVGGNARSRASCQTR